MNVIMLEFQARCFLKTKIHLKQRSFSDFSINELNDYASCIFDLMANFHIGSGNFSLNRIEKTFEFVPIISKFTLFDDLEKWEWYYSFLQYLFNVEGSKKFEYLAGVLYLKLTDNDKKKLNRFGKNFCDCLFYNLYGSVFNKHEIVKQKIVEYFSEIGILKQYKDGYAESPGFLIQKAK